MEHLSIGAFARRSRLSPKALRLYDRLGLLTPDRVDADTGYRWYRPDQVEQARLVAMLRLLDMPLARIGTVLGLPGEQAADEIAAYWAAVEERNAGRRALATRLREQLSGRRLYMHDIVTREVERQTVLAVRRHLLSDDLGTWIGTTFDELEKVVVERCGGVAAAPFVVYYAEVSQDSDGPAEVCVPVVDAAAARAYAAGERTVEVREEPAHRQVYTRLVKAQVVYPQILSAFEAVENWIAEQRLTMVAPCREVYFADWATAGPDDPVCDVAYPVA